MSLLDRLSGTQDPKLPVHQFWGSLVEWTQGEVTRQNVIDAHNISVADETDLDWLKGKIDASANTVNFMHNIHSLFMLAEDNLYGYSAQATMVARINRIT